MVQCFLCQFDALYYCRTCERNLCYKCKQNHVLDLSTADHDVVIFRNKHAYNSQKNIPIHIKEIFYKIRSETLFVRQNFQKNLKKYDKTCYNAIVNSQEEMQLKAYLLKGRIDSELPAYDYKHTLQKKHAKMISEVIFLQMFEHDFEQSTDTPITFLTVLKKSRLFHTGVASDLFLFKLPYMRFSFPVHFKSKDVINVLCEMNIRQKKPRYVEKMLDLKLMETPIVHKNVIMERLHCCLHISCVTHELLCVSDEERTVLINTKGEIIQILNNFGDQCGTHTVNTKRQLIYIDDKYNINILSIGNTLGSTFIKGSDPAWRPRCLNFSQSTETLIVGMCRENPQTGKIGKYDHTGKQIQTIQYDIAGHDLYKSPIYITENQNEDVVVTDWLNHAVVVTDSRGIFRFSYTGYPKQSEFRPRGIATDVFAHILVCDSKTNTVQIVDQDGIFISYVVIDEQKLIKPRSLCYDTNNHLLWVGSWTNERLLAYRFINRHGASFGECSNHKIWK